MSLYRHERFPFFRDSHGVLIDEGTIVKRKLEPLLGPTSS
jgi:hypothetical protein